MKKSELIVNVVLVPVDIIMLFCAAFAGYFLRFGSFVADLRPPVYEMPLSEYTFISFFVILLWIVVFAFSGLYSFHGTRSVIREFKSIFFACSTSILIIILAIFFQRELFSSRFIIIIAWVFSFLFVSIGRFVVLRIQRLFFTRGIGTHKVVLIGDGRATHVIKENIQNNTMFGYTIVKHIPFYDQHTLSVLEHLTKDSMLDEVLQADSTLPQEDERELLEFCQEKHIVFKYVPNIYEAVSVNVEVSYLAGIPIMELIRTPLDGWGRVAKRLTDIIGSIILIILTSPFMIGAVIAMKLEDKGFIIYKNGRVGYKGRIFEAYKFRSYKPEFCTDYKRETGQAAETEAEAFEKELIAKQNSRKGALYKIQNDPRITKVGGFLRKTSIDELPQLFNVLKGEMSLVGPRPHQPKEVANYQKWHMKLLAIKPGITGLAQISGRSDLEFDEEARLDITYIENWSLLSDLQILFKTPFALFKKRNVV